MRYRPLALATLLLVPAGAMAQTATPASPPPQPQPSAHPPGGPAANPAEADPVLARVDGEPLRLSDVMATAEEMLPAELRAMPPATLMPMLPEPVRRQLVERAITERALVNAARHQGLDKNPEVARRLRRVEDQELQQQLLSREIQGRVTEEAVRARYDRDIAGQQGEEEVHARHILVQTEAEAKQVLADLQAGADFAELARQRSKDPGSRDGGDLGWFKRGEMVPEFAAAAFALQPGQLSPAPVQSPFGWHVIKLEERRRAAARPFDDDMKRELREKLLQEEVNAAVRRIRSAAKIERLDQPATPPPASLLNGATPPPPAQSTPIQPQRR